jgi:hypothetical protein
MLNITEERCFLAREEHIESCRKCYGCVGCPVYQEKLLKVSEN